MNHHITLKLINREDFKLLIALIQRSGFRVLKINSPELEVECYVDQFVLYLTDKYLGAEVVYHRPDLLVPEHPKRLANLEKVNA
jgi:hypothetical protein